MPHQGRSLTSAVKDAPSRATHDEPRPAVAGIVQPSDSHEFAWTFALTASALFMFALDRLIVTNALPVIAHDLNADVAALEWTVNGFTLAFAVLLLTGAALGDRFGRRRLFTIGVGLFTAGSAAAALAPSPNLLVAARAVQGVGGAVITPLSLTLLLAATPAHRRGTVLGAWGATAAIAAASGPVVGGALAGAVSWHWLFWVNVPIGVVIVPLARTRLRESYGPRSRLDLPGLALSGAGLLFLVCGLVRAGRDGWDNTLVLTALVAGCLALTAFAWWERRAAAPMLPLSFFRIRAFAAASVTTLIAYAGLFGALFLLGQLLQTGLGLDPLHAGLGLLPLTAAMLIAAPTAGAWSDRVGARPIICGALVIETLGLLWLAIHAEPNAPYSVLVPGLAAAGIGSATLFAPIQAVFVGAVTPNRHGQASGAAITIREVGAVLGVAIVGGVFTAHGAITSSNAFLSGARPALLVAAITVAGAILGAGFLPRTRTQRARSQPATTARASTPPAATSHQARIQAQCVPTR